MASNPGGHSPSWWHRHPDILAKRMAAESALNGSEMPIAQVVPLQESTLLWSCISVVFTILFGLLAATMKDLRWLVIAAGPWGALGLWKALSKINSRKKLAFIPLGWCAIAVGLWAFSRLPVLKPTPIVVSKTMPSAVQSVLSSQPEVEHKPIATAARAPRKARKNIKGLHAIATGHDVKKPTLASEQQNQDCVGSGIKMIGATDNVVENNTAVNPKCDGITMVNSTGNTVKGNQTVNSGTKSPQ